MTTTAPLLCQGTTEVWETFVISFESHEVQYMVLFRRMEEQLCVTAGNITFFLKGEEKKNVFCLLEDRTGSWWEAAEKM